MIRFRPDEYLFKLWLNVADPRTLKALEEFNRRLGKAFTALLADLKSFDARITTLEEGGVQGSFHAYLASTVALGTATDNLVVLDTEVEDARDEYDHVTGRLTATEDSTWLITLGCQWRDQADGNISILRLYVNGGATSHQLGRQRIGGTGSSQIVTTISLDLAAGDYAELRAYTSGAANAEGGGATFMRGHRIR